MSAAALRIRLPALANPEIFNDPSRSIMSADGRGLLTYDPATRSGFIYDLESKVWLIQAPVDFLHFALVARSGGYTINDGEDATRWLRACSPNAAGENVVDFPASTRH